MKAIISACINGMLLINKYLALDWPVVVPDKSGNTGAGVSPETIIVLIVVIRF